MKTLKKIIPVFLSMLLIVSCFAGCSKTEEAEQITDGTMLVAYTEEIAPFISNGDNGPEGFDVDVFKAIAESVKGEYKNYKFVQVEEGYKIGEDTAYTDEDGNEYTANIMIGGVQSDTGTINEDYSLTDSLISNRIVTVVPKDSNIKSYADLEGAKVGIVTKQAVSALDENTSIKNSVKSVKEYAEINDAVLDLYSNKIDALISDEFTLHTVNMDVGSGREIIVSIYDDELFTILNGELDIINYVFAVKKWDGLRDSINNAIYELKSPDYNGEDEFTPIVEKYFGYNASGFSFAPEN